MTSYYLLIFLLFLYITLNVDCDMDDVDDDNGAWASAACGSYESCLRTYDTLINNCGVVQKSHFDHEEHCYLPIAGHYEILMSKKEKRNQLLRQCFSTGTIEKVQDIAKPISIIAKSIQRKKTHCRQKIGELDQHMEKLGTQLVASKVKGTIAIEKCRSIAKRFKERCQRIEGCCARVRDCRTMVNLHPVVEELRIVERKIKDVRRECMEEKR